jgi:DNA-binding response OmpR family regulator
LSRIHGFARLASCFTARSLTANAPWIIPCAPCPLPREYDPLAFLVTHRGKFFGRDRLLDLVWGIHFEGGERTVDIHIRRLRAKLPPQTADRLQTRCGTGYGFEV